MTTIIDGRRIAADVYATAKAKIMQLRKPPVLKVVMVGDNPASEIYVRNKMIAAREVGIDSETIRLPSNASERELIELLDDLGWGAGETADGIIVQLPLPPHIRTERILEAIDPARDVDGFHPLNVGWLAAGKRHNVPCTARAVMRLLEAAETPLHGAQALVVGTSAIVGRPVATLLSQAGATVTMANKSTRDLAAECARADIIVAAAGCPNLIRGRFIKPGSTIIDVGINRLPDGRVCGDVAFEECLGIAGSITPVPGGVGPMTVACLLMNTLESALTALDGLALASDN